YPVSVEQLENTNHVRFLRKKYVDPMTGDSDGKMVHVGEAQVNIPAPSPGLSGGGGQSPVVFNRGPGGNPPPGPPPTGQAQTQHPPTGQQQNQAGGTGQLGSLPPSGIGHGQT